MKGNNRAKVRRKGKNADTKGWMHRHALGLMIGVGVIVAIMAVMAGFALQSYDGDDDAWIFVPRGATAAAVGDSLKVKLGSAEGTRVYMLWRVMGGDAAVAHGAYCVKPGQKSVITARRLANGMQTPVRVGWSSVRTMGQLADKVTQRLECSSGEFLAACESVLPGEGFKQPEYPAAFVPDIYEFYWTASSEDVVRRLLDYRNKFWTGSRREKALSLGLSPVQVATLASIVEEESSKADELPKIARLYINRFERGMMLQADPTVKFAVGDFTLRRITGVHLKCESPYNTYRRKGLPPGPIRVASKTGIDAVLDAPEHGYLYMCAKSDFSGYHDFAADYASHQANARRYQAELNRRKIH